MWKFLRCKSIWVALSGMMLAAGTLFTAVDDAKADTTTYISCGSNISYTTQTVALIKTSAIGSISGTAWSGYRTYLDLNGNPQTKACWILQYTATNLSSGDSVNTKLRPYNGSTGYYTTGGCNTTDLSGYSYVNYSPSLTSSFVNLTTASASNSWYRLTVIIDKTTLPTLTSATFFVGSARILQLG